MVHSTADFRGPIFIPHKKSQKETDNTEMCCFDVLPQCMISKIRIQGLKL